MENELRLSETDIKALLFRRISLLKELLHLSQQQLGIQDWAQLSRILDQKEAHLGELQKADALFSQWQGQSERALNAEEQQLLERITRLLQEVWESEQQVETYWESEREKVSSELGQLGNRSQVRHYLNTTHAAGKHFSFRR